MATQQEKLLAILQDRALAPTHPPADVCLPAGANHKSMPSFGLPPPQRDLDHAEDLTTRLCCSSPYIFLQLLPLFTWLPLLSLSVCARIRPELEPKKMAPLPAGHASILSPISPNRQLINPQHDQGQRKRFETQMYPPSDTAHGAARSRANLATAKTHATTFRSQIGTSTSSQPKPPAAAAALNIPGFDPSRYGKPKPADPRVESIAVSKEDLPTASADASIHSSAATISTLDDSGPITPHLTFHLPTSDIDAPLPPVNLGAPSTRLDSSTTEDLPWSTTASEKQVAAHSVVEATPRQTSLLRKTDAFETKTQVTVRTEYPQSQTAPPSSLKPRTQGRPLAPEASTHQVIMKSSTNDQHRYGRPFPSSTTISGPETPQQKLERLRVNQLNSINQRNRRKDRDQTASPATLSALRLPLSPDQEQKIVNRVQYYHTLGATSPQAQNSASYEPLGPVQTSAHAGPDRSPLSSAAPQTSLIRFGRAESTVATPTPREPAHHVRTGRGLAEKSSDYYIPAHARAAPAKRNPRWATNEEIKPDEVSDDSNAWGSVDPDALSTDSGDSIMAIHHGAVRQKKAHMVETNLVGWDGKMQPPPVDWNDRPRFDNHNPDFKEAFNAWTEGVVERTIHRSPNMSFEVIDIAMIEDPNFHPDGIGMVSRQTTITSHNATKYGYSMDMDGALHESQHLTREEIKQIVTVDTKDPANQPILEETTETVVQRWLAHNGISFDSLIKATEEVPSAPKAKKECKPEPNPHSPGVGIYLRPAVKTDITQMTDIYNWHVEHGPRTAEYQLLPEQHMRERFDGVTEAKLPFIVAVMKVKRRNRRGQSDNGSSRRRHVHQNGIVNNIDPGYNGMSCEEKVVGWACAQDFTAMDYVERISAELEVYVSPEVQQQGVGNCLMDKLLDSCDRGHLKQGGYDFDCAPEKSYLYNGGGGRDLHKLYFIFRTWSQPRNTASVSNKGKVVGSRGRSKATMTAGENESEEWLQTWLEKWSFNLEGKLKQAGAKKGR
jgi:L-amino acid N-acyltransferase YncA